jgi:hypothetical protein
LRSGILTADEFKKVTATALDTLAAALDQGHSEALTATFKTMGASIGISCDLPCHGEAAYCTHGRGNRDRRGSPFKEGPKGTIWAA